MIFKITRFYKQKNESFRYKITKSEWAGLIVQSARWVGWKGKERLNYLLNELNQNRAVGLEG